MSSGAVLNAYIVAGRYPGDLAFDEVTYEDAHEAVAIVRRIKQLVTA
jgi:hypothetical protein